jgi:hypothetical protein
MSDVQHIDVEHATSTLCSDGVRLYWLSRQKDTDPIVDSMGRERRCTTLHTWDIDTGEHVVWATDLPPSDSLAACDGRAYLWGIDRQSLVRVNPSGDTETVATFETTAEGDLRSAGEKLFYLGRTRPRQMGAAVFDEALGDFAQVVSLDDPTHVALQRMDVSEDGVWSLQHDARGWVLRSYPLEGKPTDSVLTDEKLVLRWMARTDDWVAAGGSDGIHVFHDDTHTFVETEVPPDDLMVIDGRVGWIASAMTDVDGVLVEPWRIQSVAPGADIARTELESDDRIASVAAGPWGCAALTQRTSPGLDDFIVGEVSTDIVVVRFGETD